MKYFILRSVDYIDILLSFHYCVNHVAHLLNWSILLEKSAIFQNFVIDIVFTWLFTSVSFLCDHWVTAHIVQFWSYVYE